LRWELPEPYRWWSVRGAVYSFGIVVLIMFLFTWMGLGNNCASPRCWGDAIPFTDALAKLPRIILAVLVAVAIALALMGIRSEPPSK